MTALTFPAVAAVSAGFCALLIVALHPLLVRYAMARPNARSSHRIPTPQGGGLAVGAAGGARGGLAGGAPAGGSVPDIVPDMAAVVGPATARWGRNRRTILRPIPLMRTSSSTVRNGRRDR